MKKKNKHYIKQTVSKRIFRQNSKLYWKEVRKIRKRVATVPICIDDVSDNVCVVNILRDKYHDLYNSVPHLGNFLM